MWDIIIDTFSDGVKLLPFLFATYLIMEYIEHKMGEKAKNAIEKSGRLGPLFGGVLGIFPQCGFSAAASGLYAGRVITLGTLLAVFLSTSDEMLPILISEQVNAIVIFKLLGMKALVGITAGILVDFFAGKLQEKGYGIGGGQPGHVFGEAGAGHGCGEGEKGCAKGAGCACQKGRARHMDIGHICGHENCRWGDGIIRPALRRTGNIFLFLLLATFALNLAVHLIGEEFLAGLILNRPLFGHMIAGLVGLVPNCASSAIITKLYLGGAMGLGVMMSGLLVGSGVGLAVLFRVNGHGRENMRIALLLYAIGVAAGILTDILGITV